MTIVIMIKRCLNDTKVGLRNTSVKNKIKNKNKNNNKKINKDKTKRKKDSIRKEERQFSRRNPECLA